jgi:glycosidase
MAAAAHSGLQARKMSVCRFFVGVFAGDGSESFMRFWHSLICVAAWCCVPAVCVAQAPRPASADAQKPASADAPKIDKIDPPGWWSGLPDPMLLVHGENLNQARFALDGKGVTLAGTQSSVNGHWAFLWLHTKAAASQTLWVEARNDRGHVRSSFVLAARSRDANSHRGFSSADTLYLVITDRFAEGSQTGNRPGIDRSAPRGWHGGDFAGIEQHLDYLQQLGVTTLWTTPVVSNGAMPESYHGYAATDLYNADAHFGVLADYRHLSDVLHAHGMKLVIDLVPNHIGDEHPWVHDPPAPNWFHGTLEDHLAAQHDFYQLADPHAPRAAWRAITEGWFTRAMPDLNQENPLVARYLIQNAIWWVETANLDGIRLDTFPYVGRGFWRDFDAELHAVYPHLTIVGEIFHRDPQVTSFFAGGIAHDGIDTGLDTPFDFPICFALRDVLAHGKPMTELADVLRQDALYPHPEQLATFIGNHDTTRFVTEVGGSVPKLKLALGLLLTLRGMPTIYSGDEIGMAGGADPDDRRDFPGGFPGDARSAFQPSGRTAAEDEVFRWTSRLLALRAAHTEIETGIEQNLYADSDSFAFVRATSAAGCSPQKASERLLIVVNRAPQSEAIELPLEETALAGCTSFDSVAAAPGEKPVFENGKLRVKEPAESMTIYAVH